MPAESSPINRKIVLFWRARYVRGRLSALHNVIADRVPDQFGDRMKAEFLHDVSPVGFHGLDTDLENEGNLFVRLAFGNQFDDLSLPRADPAGGRVRD